MFSSELLPIYLNDHLALATAGRDLARRTAKQNEGSEMGAFLDDLAGQVEADLKQLEDVMERLAIKRDPVKTGATWLGEKLGRLKLNGRLISYSPLSRVIEVEGLIAAVRANASLWRTLAAAAADDQRLADIDFAHLTARSEEQVEGLTAQHAQAVELMLAEDA
jgi:hypothetical protein